MDRKGLKRGDIMGGGCNTRNRDLVNVTEYNFLFNESDQKLKHLKVSEPTSNWIFFP